MERIKIKDILAKKSPGMEVAVEGWVRTRRDSKGGFSFLMVNDGSTIKNIQVIVDKSIENYESEVLQITTGTSVHVEGMLSESPGQEQDVELKASVIKVFGYADESFPLQKKRHSFEFLREIAHLRPRSNTFGAIGRIRHGLSYAVHKFFHERDFFYIHTPIITASDCEGAGEMFKVTEFDLSSVPVKNGVPDFEQDFFKQSAYLSVSGQLEAEIYACALGDVYTFGPTFRAE
ncbi:OB-fold nucleic acid binding domain-containing protein, partial [Elusimicrobiota bacterium]